MSSIDKEAHGVDFNAVYSAFYPRILRYLARLVGPDDAEDVSQEVFIKVSRALGDYRGEGLSSWVYRIATNAAMDRRRGAGPIAIPAEEEALAPDSAETAEQRLIRGEMSECVRGLIDELPDTYRAVLILSEIEGLADAEIGSVVGASLETVKIRLHRARRRLREALVDRCNLYHDGDHRLLCDQKAQAGH
ncbi:RNA polymerase sigma factor [Paludibaculum fermentans]|uniref:RNA polymerase sigma factor n=1 Tax=Paludibaculum fermentans TaxID=1473598 RepID=UPI003EB7F617